MQVGSKDPVAGFVEYRPSGQEAQNQVDEVVCSLWMTNAALCNEQVDVSPCVGRGLALPSTFPPILNDVFSPPLL